MQTNKTITEDSDLSVKAKALLKAAHEYWEEYRKEMEPAAVVWLEDDSGHFVLFTRGEYKRGIMSGVDGLKSEPAMFAPFEAKEGSDE